MAKKNQTPMELAIEIVERESAKWFKIASDDSKPVEERQAAMKNSQHLDNAADELKLVKE